MPKKLVSRGRIELAKKPEAKKPQMLAAPKIELKVKATAPKKIEPEITMPKISKTPPTVKPSKNIGSSSGYSAKNITVLEGLEAVRKRPGMYIGSTGATGLHHLIWEVVDNSIDEAMAGHCTQITIELLPDHWVSVIDNGRGIPVDMHPIKKVSALELVLCTLHAGGKFGEEGGYKVSGGLHGVGASVVNALSTNMKAIVHRDGKIWEQEYEYGKPTKKVKSVGNSKITGTTIMFHADNSIFETLDYEWKYIIDHVRQQAYLTKGIHIIIKDKRGDEEKTKDASSLSFPITYQFYFEGGIASYTKHINKNKEVKHETVFYVDKKADDVTVEIALQYTDDYSESLFAFANNIANPDGGMHVAGFRTALTRTLNNYARNKGILKEKDVNLTGDDVREGLTAIISVKIPNPQFEGQTKAKLGNPEVKPAVENIFSEQFAIYLEEHPKDAEAIIGKCIISAKARAAAKMARDTVLRKSALEGFTLPGKLADCSSRNAEESELFIVEGDSAGGSAKQGRDRHTQAILPLRGKVLNVERARIDKILTNNELKSLIIAMGTNIGEMFDISKLRYHRIIIMTDADVDGSHIRTLLLTLFFRYFPDLIHQGHIYIAQPPLYSLKKGKETSWIYNEKTLEEHLKKFGIKTEEIQITEDDDNFEGEKIEIKEEKDKPKAPSFSIQRYKGLGEMNPEQLWETTMNPDNRIIRQVAIEDAEKASEIFDILMGSEVAPRKHFIQTQAKNVKNLDV